jgi:hypothetical protein
MRNPPAILRSARTFLALRGEARGFALGALAVAPVVELSLRVLGLQRTKTWIEAAPRRAPRPGAVAVDEGERLVVAAFRWSPIRGACLGRALVQHLMHNLTGVPTKIVIGVDRDAERIRAHAWVAPPESATLGNVGHLPLVAARGRA